MKKYEVSVTRIGYAHTTIEVEAESEEQAEQKAIDMAGNYDFSEHDADYECNGVTIVEPDDDTTLGKAIRYVREQMDEDDMAILHAEMNNCYKMHLIPNSNVMDCSKVIDLLEEYGQDNDLPEGWWESECEMDDILVKL